jgi:SAM-dependent methyltransferase
MKVRDSGMPEQSYWESLFNIDAVLDGLDIDARIEEAAEVGCGYGTFTLPVARRIKGVLHTFDIEKNMVDMTRARAAAAGITNIQVGVRDVVAEGFGPAVRAVDAVLLFNILHAEAPLDLLRAAAGILRPGGRILAIHWRSDVATPRGPDLSIRPRPEQIAAWAQALGLIATPSRLLPPWHFGIALRR